MKANVRLVLALILFAVSVASSMHPQFVKAAGCPQVGEFLIGQTVWYCALRGEQTDGSCTYYNVNESTRSDECWKGHGELD